MTGESVEKTFEMSQMMAGHGEPEIDLSDVIRCDACGETAKWYDPDTRQSYCQEHAITSGWVDVGLAELVDTATADIRDFQRWMDALPDDHVFQRKSDVVTTNSNGEPDSIHDVPNPLRDYLEGVTSVELSVYPPLVVTYAGDPVTHIPHWAKLWDTASGFPLAFSGGSVEGVRPVLATLVEGQPDIDRDPTQALVVTARASVAGMPEKAVARMEAEYESVQLTQAAKVIDDSLRGFAPKDARQMMWSLCRVKPRDQPERGRWLLEQSGLEPYTGAIDGDLAFWLFWRSISAIAREGGRLSLIEMNKVRKGWSHGKQVLAANGLR